MNQPPSSELPAGRIQPYDKPAGGWGALRTSLQIAHQQTGIVRGLRALLRVNQPTGFDCPGCAWPDPGKAHTFEFCENGVKAVAWEATARRVTPEFFAAHAVSELLQWSDRDLEAQGRLTHPMRYNSGTDHYEPVTWEQTFELLGQTLRGLRQRGEADRAVFYTSGRTSNEAAFLYQLFARRLGTNNLPDCSNMCHESSGVALTQVIGVGKGTVTLDDFDAADCILIIGQNPGTNHPRMLTTLQAAARRGCRIVTMNPLRERGLVEFLHPQEPLAMATGRGTPISTRYLQVAVGGDLAALKGICRCVIESGRVDRAFIDGHTSGYEAFAADVTATPWDQIECQSGLSRSQLQQAAEDYCQSRAAIACWAMGLTQHKHAVATIQMVVNLLLLRGNLGRPGAGACPVRGHSNVQGDRTVGIVERPQPEFLDALQRAFGFDPPRAHGYDTVAAIGAMAAGHVDVFFAMGGNFAAAAPDLPHTHAALRRCQITAQVSTKLNRSHLVVGRDALILPCLARSEQDGAGCITVEDSMSMVHASAGANAPASEHLLSEPAIVARLAQAVFGPDAAVDWSALAADYNCTRDAIERVMPDAFARYNQRIRQPGGFYLGNAAARRQWRTATGKATFTVHAIPDLSLPPGRLKLMTLRSHDQYNTTIYDDNDRYRGVYGTRRVIFVHGDDLAAADLRDGDIVDVQSHFDDGEHRCVSGFRAVAYDIPRGCAAGYFPELNPLVSVNSYAVASRTPTSKFIPVTLHKTTMTHADARGA